MAAKKTSKISVKKTRQFKRSKAVAKKVSPKTQAEFGVIHFDRISRLYIAKLHQMENWVKILAGKIK